MPAQARHGFNTHEAVERLLNSSVENIIAFIEENPKNLVIKFK
jgi:hypothetical protein